LRNWKPYILTIEPKDTIKYLLWVSFISDTEKVDKILTTVNISAIKENGKWVLKNTIKDIVKAWQTKQFKYIKYVFSKLYI